MTINRMYTNKLLGYRELNAKFAYGLYPRICKSSEIYTKWTRFNLNNSLLRQQDYYVASNIGNMIGINYYSFNNVLIL